MPAPLATRKQIDNRIDDRVPFGDYAERMVYFDNFIQAATDNPRFALSGTNSAAAGEGFDADGGVALATAGAENDQMIYAPGGGEALSAVTFDPAFAPRLDALIELPSVADIRVHLGLSLTAALDLTTDDDQVKLAFDSGGSTGGANWTAATSIGGNDAESDTGVVAETARTVHLTIRVSETRVPRFYIDGVKKHTGSALTDGADLQPMLGVQALTGSAKSLKLRQVRLSRLLNTA